MVSFETVSELEFKTLISRVEGIVFLKCDIIYPIQDDKYTVRVRNCENSIKDLNAKVLAILGKSGKSDGDQQQEQQQATVDSESDSESEDETQTTGKFKKKDLKAGGNLLAWEMMETFCLGFCKSQLCLLCPFI